MKVEVTELSTNHKKNGVLLTAENKAESRILNAMGKSGISLIAHSQSQHKIEIMAHSDFGK